jgi:alkylhydroperoxidase/carboxymuconolactone decarboxylase family protein YurZ
MADRDTGAEIVEAMLGAVIPSPGLALADMMAPTSGDPFGEVWSRSGLARRNRALNTVSVPVA